MIGMVQPVPAAEVFIKQEPLGEVVARGTTDEKGRFVANLKRGKYTVAVLLPPEAVQRVAILGVRVSGAGQLGEPEQSFSVAFTRTQGGPYSQSFSNLDDNSVGVDVVSRGARPPLAAALEAGRWTRALDRKPCYPLAELLVTALSECFGVRPRARTEAQAGWSPRALHEVVVWEVPVSDGIFRVTIEIARSVADGRALIKVGDAFQAATPEQVKEMALALNGAITDALGGLGGVPDGVVFEMQAGGSKGGFAVGGISGA